MWLHSQPFTKWPLRKIELLILCESTYFYCNSAHFSENCGKFHCSLFWETVSSYISFSFFYFHAVDFLCPDNNDIVFSLGWSLYFLCLWICSFCAVVLFVLYVSASDGRRVSLCSYSNDVETETLISASKKTRAKIIFQKIFLLINHLMTFNAFVQIFDFVWYINEKLYC